MLETLNLIERDGNIKHVFYKEVSEINLLIVHVTWIKCCWFFLLSKSGDLRIVSMQEIYRLWLAYKYRFLEFT